RREGHHRLLRERPRSARPLAVLAADGALSRGVRLPALLDPPGVPRRRVLEISRGASFVGGGRLDLRRAVPSGQSVARPGAGRRGAAAGRHSAGGAGHPGAVQRADVRLRARQSELVARALQIRDRKPGIPPLAPHRARPRRYEEFRRHLPDLRPHVRHVLHAGGQAARRLRDRRSAVSPQLRRPAHVPVPPDEDAMMVDAIRLMVFPALMAFAASSDFLTMTIPNKVSLLLVAGFLALALLTGMSMSELGWHFAAGALVLAVA